MSTHRILVRPVAFDERLAHDRDELAIAGIVPGVLLAYAAGRSMEALLAGVRPTDGPTLATAVALSFLMTVLGTLVPTVRALRVDPMTALRAE